MRHNALDMLDANMMAFVNYSRNVDRAEKIEAMLEASIADNLKKIEQLAEEIRGMAKEYEDDCNLDFSDFVEESIKYAAGVIR